MLPTPPASAFPICGLARRLLRHAASSLQPAGPAVILHLNITDASLRWLGWVHLLFLLKKQTYIELLFTASWMSNVPIWKGISSHFSPYFTLLKFIPISLSSSSSSALFSLPGAFTSPRPPWDCSRISLFYLGTEDIGRLSARV